MPCPGICICFLLFTIIYCRMLTNEECELFNSRMKGTMIEALGIRFLPSDDDVALAEMPYVPLRNSISEFCTAVPHWRWPRLLQEQGRSTSPEAGTKCAVCRLRATTSACRLVKARSTDVQRLSMPANRPTSGMWISLVKTENSYLLKG